MLLLALLAPELARAGDPRLKWRTLESEHFYIHYYTLPDGPGEAEIAQHLAAVAEEAHRRLLPYLAHPPRRKTHVVIGDVTDDANGSASVIPYEAIHLNATSPDDRSFLNDYDDWLSALITHEYTHILHIDTIFGPCAWVINALLGFGFGTIDAPNQAQPRYIIEGLAVFEESERTSGGRLRNSIWDMYLRMATLEHRFQRLDQFVNEPIQFPFANSAYLYGSTFLRYVAKRYGQEALTRMSFDYGGVCIPWGLNRNIRHVTGKTWVELYADYRADTERRYQEQRQRLERRGLTPLRTLTSYREFVARPVFTPDGHIIYSDSDGYTRPQLRRLDPRTGQARTELLVDAAGGPSLTADGRTLVFHATDFWRTNYYWNDLYLYRRDRREKRRLTFGVRATNPAISPDGSQVVFEVNDATSRGLGRLATDACAPDNCAVEMLIPAAGMEQVYTPVFSPDGKTVAFSWWRQGGYRDIWTMDLGTRALTRITHDRSLDLEPRFSPDGRWLYFVSDRTEVYNLYGYELVTRRLFQVTNVLGGVFDPDISPDGRSVVFVGFQADGYVLQMAALDPAQFQEATPPLIDRPEAEPAESLRLRSRSYNPLPTLLPYSLHPFAYADSYGEVLGVDLNGSDVVGNHAWTLSLGFGTGRSDDVNFSANYNYYRLWPSLGVGVAHSLGRRGGLILNGINRGYDEEDWSFGAGITLPLLRHIVSSSNLSFSYSLTLASSLTPVPPPDPSALVPVYPQTGRIAGIGIGWSYALLRRYTYSVSIEQGRIVALSLALANRALGSDYAVYSASWSWHEFIPMPWKPKWLRNQVLSLAYSGGVSGGDLRRRGLYYLGGYPPQDLLRSIYDFTRPGGAALRGYPYGSVYGDQFHVVNLEYRFPIVWVEHGYETLPLYLRRLHARGFVDYGAAFFGGFDLDKMKLGVGGELILEIFYAYYVAASFQLGFAHGFSKGGGNEIYFLLNQPF